MKVMIVLAAALTNSCLPGVTVNDYGKIPLQRTIADGDAVRGRQLFSDPAYACASCHSLSSVPRARGLIGPPLTDLSRRGFIAGSLPNTPETLVQFLIDPASLQPETGMPSLGLDRASARHLAAFLYTSEAQR